MHEVHPHHVENRKVNLPILHIKKRLEPLFFADSPVMPGPSRSGYSAKIRSQTQSYHTYFHP